MRRSKSVVCETGNFWGVDTTGVFSALNSKDSRWVTRSSVPFGILTNDPPFVAFAVL